MEKYGERERQLNQIAIAASYAGVDNEILGKMLDNIAAVLFAGDNEIDKKDIERMTKMAKLCLSSRLPHRLILTNLDDASSEIAAMAIATIRNLSWESPLLSGVKQAFGEGIADVVMDAISREGIERIAGRSRKYLQSDFMEKRITHPEEWQTSKSAWNDQRAKRLATEGQCLY